MLCTDVSVAQPIRCHHCKCLFRLLISDTTDKTDRLGVWIINYGKTVCSSFKFSICSMRHFKSSLIAGLFGSLLAPVNIYQFIFFLRIICVKNWVKMQRITALKRVSVLPALPHRGYNNHVQKRYLATVKEVFPNKTDFPSRHIGPRKTEVVAMLDLVGYKVCC